MPDSKEREAQGAASGGSPANAQGLGYEAGKLGKPPRELPYSLFSDEGRLWIVGYHDGLDIFFKNRYGEVGLPGTKRTFNEDYPEGRELVSKGFDAGNRGHSPQSLPTRLNRDAIDCWARGYHDGVQQFFERLDQTRVHKWNADVAKALLAAALAVALLVYPAIYAWIARDRISSESRQEQERTALQREIVETLALRPAPAVSLPTASPAQGSVDAAGLIQRYLDAQAAKGEKTSASALSAFIDSLASAGMMLTKQAEDLKSAIQKAAIDGGKEIVVDLAKNIVGALFKSEPSKVDVSGTPKSIEIDVTQNNGSAPCPGSTTCRTCQPRPKPRPGSCSVAVH